MSRSKLSTSNTDANLAVSESVPDLGWKVLDSKKKKRKSSFKPDTFIGDDQEAVEERRQLAAVRSSCVYFSSAPN